MENIGLPELTTAQLEILCSTAEDAARKYVLSRVSLKDVERLNVYVEAEGSKPLNLIIDVDLALSTPMKNIDEKKLADEAAKTSLRAAEDCLKTLR